MQVQSTSSILAAFWAWLLRSTRADQAASTLLLTLAGSQMVLALKEGNNLTTNCDASEACFLAAQCSREMQPLNKKVLQ